MNFGDVLHVLVDQAAFANDSSANQDLKAEAHQAIDDYLGNGNAAPVDVSASAEASATQADPVGGETAATAGAAETAAAVPSVGAAETASTEPSTVS